MGSSSDVYCCPSTEPTKAACVSRFRSLRSLCLNVVLLNSLVYMSSGEVSFNTALLTISRISGRVSIVLPLFFISERSDANRQVALPFLKIMIWLLSFRYLLACVSYLTHQADPVERCTRVLGSVISYTSYGSSLNSSRVPGISATWSRLVGSGRALSAAFRVDIVYLLMSFSGSSSCLALYVVRSRFIMFEISVAFL